MPHDHWRVSDACGDWIESVFEFSGVGVTGDREDCNHIVWVDVNDVAGVFGICNAEGDGVVRLHAGVAVEGNETTMEGD